MGFRAAVTVVEKCSKQTNLGRLIDLINTGTTGGAARWQKDWTATMLSQFKVKTEGQKSTEASIKGQGLKGALN